jgi:hypothetical protein
VRVQLVHAVTKQTSSSVYTVDTQLLAQLYANAATATAAAADSEGGSSIDAQQSASRQNVLLKMLVPSEGWQSSIGDELKLISYDGKVWSISLTSCTHVHMMHQLCAALYMNVMRIR